MHMVIADLLAGGEQPTSIEFQATQSLLRRILRHLSQERVRGLSVATLLSSVRMPECANEEWADLMRALRGNGVIKLLGPEDLPKQVFITEVGDSLLQMLDAALPPAKSH